MPLIKKVRDKIERVTGCRSNSVSVIVKRMVLSSVLVGILSLLPTDVSLAAVFKSDWIGDPYSNWSISGNWNPVGVPNNSSDTYRVTIDGPSSIVTLDDMDPVIEALNLSGAAELLINGKTLEFEDRGFVGSSIINNSGVIHLQGTAGSTLVINGEVEYRGNGIIYFDDSPLHGIEGSGSNNQKLFVDTGNSMFLEGATMAGGQGFLGLGLLLENRGTLEIMNFKGLYLFAPDLDPPPPTPWFNRGNIYIHDNSTVYLKGKLDQTPIPGYDAGSISVSKTLNLQNAYIIEGKIEGSGQTNAAGLTLEDAELYTALTSTANLTIKGSSHFDSIRFNPGASMSVSGDANLTGDSDWDFASDGSEFLIDSLGETATLKLWGTHNFTGGKVKLASLKFVILEGAQLIISNEAKFWLAPEGSIITGKMLTKNGGSADLLRANVMGELIADEGSIIQLGNGTVVAGGTVETAGTGRVIGNRGTLNCATVNGDAQIGKLNLVDKIYGNFVVHCTGSSDLYINLGDTHLVPGATMHLSFEGTSNELRTDPQNPSTLYIDAGATLKLSGQEGETVYPFKLLNNGTIEANNVSNFEFSSNFINNGTIRTTNGSTLIVNYISNDQGTIIVGADSKVELSSGILNGGKLQGPVGPQGYRFANAMDGAFVGRGGGLKDVDSDATIIVPDGESLKIANSLTNKGQLIIEGSSEIGAVKLDSQVTTFDGGGEIVFAGGKMAGPYASDSKLINQDNTISGAGEIDSGGSLYPMTITNRGVIRADQTTVLDITCGVLTNEGVIEAVGSGGLKTSAFFNKGTAKVESGSSLDTNSVTQESGSFQVNGGFTFGSSNVGKVKINGGTFSGLTAVQNLSLSGGTLNIAKGIGELEVNATYSQGSGAVLAVQLGGYEPGVSYDRIRTNTSGYGSTNLGGIVSVSTVGDFEPKPGDEFVFFRHGPRSGQFASVVNATPYPLQFDLVYGSSSVTLKVSDLPTLYVAKDGICDNNKPCYTSIQKAINDAVDGSLIKIAQGTYNESPTLNQSNSLILQGGWNSSYTTQTPNTTVIKSPKAPQGSLRIQEVSIRP